MELFSLIPAAIILLPISWTWLRLSKMQDKLEDTYQKSEVKELIDLKNQPIIDAVERNTKSQDDLAKAIQELREELHKILMK